MKAEKLKAIFFGFCQQCFRCRSHIFSYREKNRVLIALGPARKCLLHRQPFTKTYSFGKQQHNDVEASLLRDTSTFAGH